MADKGETEIGTTTSRNNRSTPLKSMSQFSKVKVGLNPVSPNSQLGGRTDHGLLYEHKLITEVNSELNEANTVQKIPNLKFSVLHQNIQYLGNKVDRLEIFLKQEIPDVVVLSEHGLKDNELSQISIPGFSIRATYCRQIHKSGGICILTNITKNKEIKTRRLQIADQFSHEMDMETVGIEVRLGDSTKIAIAGIYRSPNGDWSNFCNYFSGLLESLVDRFTNIIIVGDFNVDLAIQGKLSEHFRDIVNMNYLEIKVDEFTRITSHSQTIIDNILTNIDNCKARIGGSELSDHGFQVLEVMGDLGKKSRSSNNLTREIHQEYIGNINCLKQCLSNENWENVFVAPDINQKYEKFISVLKFHYKNSCPMKEVKVKSVVSEANEWITDHILELRSEVRDAYIDLKNSRTLISEQRYRDLKKGYEREVLTAKRMRTAEVLKNSGNLNLAIWDVINDNRGSTSNKGFTDIPKIIKENNEIIENGLDICNYFNKYYQQVAANLQHDIACPARPVMNKDGNINKLEFQPVTHEELVNIIDNLKSKRSVGLDGISSILIKDCKSYLIPPLLHLINYSLEEGTFPDKLKEGKIMPIFKSGDNKLAGNYRPISLLNAISKIFERVVLVRLLNHLADNGIIAKEQHGFQRGKSTKSAIVSIVEQIIDILESGDKALAIFIDLCKAFDCVNHRILLQTLESLGITGVELNWFESYLIGRTQCVELTKEVNGKLTKYLSSRLEVKAGVPQGSIIGPILFLLYINRLPRVLSDGSALLFADDTSIICKSHQLDALEVNSCINVQSVVQFLNELLLSVNGKKSQYLQFRNKHNVSRDREIDVVINNSPLEQANSVKFLGVLLDRSLTWVPYIDQLCNKISSGVFAIKHIARLRDQKLLLAAYHGLILSHIRYAILVWGNSSLGNLERVFKIQKKAIRYMKGVHRLETCRPLFKELGLLTVPCLYIYEVIMYAKQNTYTRNLDVHNYNTRHRSDYQMIRHNTTLFEQKPSYAGKKFINKLPQSLKECDNLILFKKQLKTYLVVGTYYSIQEFINE